MQKNSQINSKIMQLQVEDQTTSTLCKDRTRGIQKGELQRSVHPHLCKSCSCGGHITLIMGLIIVYKYRKYPTEPKGKNKIQF